MKLSDFPTHVQRRILRDNPDLGGAGQDAVMECPAGNAPLEKDKGEKSGSGKFLVRFESVRKRLIDPDNLSPKWLLDALRFAGTIPGDEPEKIELQVTQRKCLRGEAEKTIITILK